MLHRGGGLVQEIPILSGDLLQFAIRDLIAIDPHPEGPFDWQVHAPGVLARAEVRKEFVSGVSEFET